VHTGRSEQSETVDAEPGHPASGAKTPGADPGRIAVTVGDQGVSVPSDGAAAIEAGGGACKKTECAATCEIVNQRGLHARAAARFVRTAETFEASVKVFNRGQEVSGHSIMGLMMLAAGQGSRIRIICDGRQAGDALEALKALIAAGFDEG